MYSPDDIITQHKHTRKCTIFTFPLVFSWKFSSRNLSSNQIEGKSTAICLLTRLRVRAQGVFRKSYIKNINETKVHVKISGSLCIQ